jgi:serine/threonine protein kinase
MASGGGGSSEASYGSELSLERFEKLRLLGSGAFGAAHEVCDKVTGQTLALKVSAITDPKVRAAALSEAAILRKLEHVNVVEIISQWEEKAFCCILLELCDGSVSDLIQDARARGFLISEAFILHIFCQLCTGLSYVHSCGFLHRDIKNANILWKRGENDCLVVKLADFGISRHLRDGSVAHTFIGSPFSLSPEILNGSPYDNKTDIWSLGCVLFELCALSNPFGGKNASLGSIVSSIFKGSYPSLDPLYSSELNALLSSLLTLNPQDRPDIASVLRLPIIQHGLATLELHQPLQFLSSSPFVAEHPAASSGETLSGAGWGSFSGESTTSSASAQTHGGEKLVDTSIYDTLPAHPPLLPASQSPYLSMAAMLRQTAQQHAKK